MSELIERVARKIDPWAWQEVGDGKMSNIPAAVFQRAVSLKRAPDAIAAVAEWAMTQGHEGEADYLITLLCLQLEQSK